MANTVSDVMTKNPVTIECGESAAEAARLMARGDMGDVIVLDNGRVAGIVTDRDIAVRLVAEERDPRTPVAEIVSDRDLVTVAPDMPLDLIALPYAEELWRCARAGRDRARKASRPGQPTGPAAIRDPEVILPAS